MKQLSIDSPHYNFLLTSFKEWLLLIGYAQTTCTSVPDYVREFLHYLEQKQVGHITQVTPQRVYSFLYYIKHRQTVNRGTALSNSSINKFITSINLFAQYLSKNGHHDLDVTPKRPEGVFEKRVVLTRQEIQQLYDATFLDYAHNNTAYGQRDRAMIAIFYGCGLRKDEAVRLDITDIDFTRARLIVRKGKGNKQRYVPIAAKHLVDIKDYLREGRNWFLIQHKCVYYYRFNIKKQNTDDEAFFLGTYGTRMQSGFYPRLKQLKEKAGIEKEFSPHSLRHSIATHLLQSGMDIEDIAKFLGHTSLESTQIYTHILEELLLTETTPQVTGHEKIASE